MSSARLRRLTCMIDLQPATTRLGALVEAITDDQLAAPTPCPAYTVGDLLDHVAGLAVAFRMAATKEVPPGGCSQDPQPGDAGRLDPNWRTEIPAALAAMADAYGDPPAWIGMTQAGGIDLPGEVAGLVALNEVIVHGWDLARATGHPYEVDPASVEGAVAFVSRFCGPGTEDQRGDAFGPEVAVDADATPLERLVAMTGRDPAWRPA